MLRSIATALLLAVLFFNSIGYRILANILESEATRHLQANLDDETYSEADLLTITIPAPNLGYAVPSLQFQPVRGQIELAGVKYNYVKRRFYNDSLELKYIPNHAATRWLASKNRYFQTVNDLQHPAPGKGEKSGHKNMQNAGDDFWSIPEAWLLLSISSSSHKRFPAFLSQPGSDFSSTAGRPPQAKA